MNKLIEKLTEQAVEEMDQEAFSEDMFDHHEAIKAMHQGKVVKCIGTVNGNENHI